MVSVAEGEAVRGEALQFQAHAKQIVGCGHSGIHIGLHLFIYGTQLCLCRGDGGLVQFQFHYLVVVFRHLLQDVLGLQFHLQFRHVLSYGGQTVAVHYLTSGKERLCHRSHHGIGLVHFANGEGLSSQSRQLWVYLSQSRQFLGVVTVGLHHLVEGMEGHDVGGYFGEVFCEGFLFLFSSLLNFQGCILQGAVACGCILQALLKGEGTRLSLHGKAAEEEKTHPQPPPSMEGSGNSRLGVL